MRETRVRMRISNNTQAKDYNEFENMVSIQVMDDKLSLTDFVFNDDRTIKFIKSELSKEDLKILMMNVIEKHYEKYK